MNENPQNLRAATDLKEPPKFGQKIHLLDPHDDVVVDHSANGRFLPERLNLDRMIYSLLEEGQLQPIKVFKRPDNKYQVIMGNIRTLAARQINDLKLAPGGEKFLLEATLAPPGNSEDHFKMNIHENLERQALKTMDIATQLRMWTAIFHKDIAWCCKFYGEARNGRGGRPMSPAWVGAHLALLKLEGAVQEKIQNGEISWQTGREMAGLTAQEQQELIQEYGSGGGKITTDTVVKRKRQLNRLSRPRSRPKKEVIEVLAGIAGSPDCPKRTKEFLDMLVEFIQGQHDMDELSDIAWKLS